MKSLIKVVSRLVPITALGMLLAAAPTSTFAQAQSSSADWTQFLRDNMQRWNPYETVLGVGNVASLGLKWSSPYSIWSSAPAVVNGLAYIGANDGTLYALNAITGVVLWSFPTAGGAIISSPAVANGVVYIGSFNNSKLYALNATTGAELWSYTAGDAVSASPTVANGVVYFGAYDGKVYALNGTTGALVWSYKTGGFIYGSAAVLDGVVYVGSADNNVYALNTTTGAKLWSYNTGSSLMYSPAVANGIVYIGTTFSGEFFALNTKTGAKLWSYITGPIQSAPAVANGVVYVGNINAVGFPTGHMYAFNAGTGALMWQYDPEADVESSPAVANGVLYFGANNGNVYALNAIKGAKLWSSYTGAPVQSSPAVVNGTLYIGTQSQMSAFALGGKTADLFLRIQPSATTIHQGDLLTYAFPVWNLGPENADQEVLNTQVPAGTTFDYIRISGTPGLGTCTHPPYQGTGQIICHEGDGMAPNTTWTVRLTVKVTAPAGTTITESAATMADTPDPNLANNMATATVKVQ